MLQKLFFIYFLIPSLQFVGFTIIQIKIVLMFTFLLFLYSINFIFKSTKFKKTDVILFSFLTLYLVVHLVFSILTGELIGNMSFYIELVSGICIYFVIRYSKETIDSKIWFKLIIISISIAFLQQMPISRDIFMPLYGSVQGYISAFPYSRASGLTVGFYVYTQILLLMFLIYKLSLNNQIISKKLSLFIYLGSLLSNTRSTFLLPFYYMFLEFKFVYKLIISMFAVFGIWYLVENFAPIKVIFHHLYLVYEAGNFTPIIESQNSSFAQRISDIFWFFELIEQNFNQMLFLGMGHAVSDGQEIGFFLIFTRVGIILGILFYLMPLFLVLFYLKARAFLRYFILIFPILLADLLVSGFVKYDLYIMYWLFTSFYIKYNLGDVKK